MRRLRAPYFLFGLLVSAPAFAQDVQPEEVKLDDQAAPAAAPAAPAAATPAPAAAPAAGATAQAGVSLGANGAKADAAAKADGKTAEGEEEAEGERGVGSYGGPVTNDSDSWKFGFNGYFRAPMRIGLGKRDLPASGQSSTTYHAPLVPDDQYLSWQHTKHSNRDWAELFFSYGNSWAKGIVAIQGFNFTDASSALPGTQFGVSQGWLEITPELPVENMRLTVKAGSFWNRYGQMGRYDAGEYDTFIFGRTHAMGENVRLELDLEGQPMTIGIEHGIGTKRPDPSVYNSARFTMLHHMHADMTWDKSIQVGVHALFSWASEEARFTGPQPAWVAPNARHQGYQTRTQPDGSMRVFGADARFDMPDLFGYLYLGGSYIQAKDAVTVAPAIEVIHSFGGGEYNMGVTGNYLDSQLCQWGLGKCSNGNGGIMTFAGQYEMKLSDMMGGSPFGEGQDLTVKLYGMYNRIKSDDPIADATTKMKFGTDAIFNIFPVLAGAIRFDYLAPNSRVKEQNFMILSPRLIFRSAFVTHEQISLQYSRYLYTQRECVNGTPADVQGARPEGAGIPTIPGAPGGLFNVAPVAAEQLCVQPSPSAVTPDGWGANVENGGLRERGQPVTSAHLRPDVNVVSIEASMWW